MQNRLAAVRKALKLSQREFGEKLGVSRDVISNIENGRVPPKELFISLVCQQYKVNRHWLESGDGEMFSFGLENKEDDKLNEALSIFASLRPEFQNYALEQIKILAQLQDLQS